MSGLDGLFGCTLLLGKVGMTLRFCCLGKDGAAPLLVILCLAILSGNPAIGQSPPRADGVGEKVRSFRKPPLEPENIADVFREQSELGQQPGPIDGDLFKEDLSESGKDGGSDNAEPQTVEAAKQAAEIASLITQLGAPEFANRERATAGLRKLGSDALPALRVAAENHSDLEVRLRAEDVATGIVNSSVAGRIDSFLEGQPGSFDGWEVYRKILGDGPRLREVFIEMMLRHEDLAQALEVSTDARARALETTIARVQQRQLIQSQLPSAADVFGILLCFNDPDLNLTNVREGSLLRMLRMSVTGEVLKDDQLNEPFRAALAGWIQRSQRSNWPEIFWMSMQHNMDRTLSLAQQALALKDASIDEIGLSLQLISRFGEAGDVSSVEPFLSDDRVAVQQGFVNGEEVQGQIRDLAAATIVILLDKPLEEVGLNPNAAHPKIGFSVTEIGFTEKESDKRIAMLEAVKKLIADAKAQEPPKAED